MKAKAFTAFLEKKKKSPRTVTNYTAFVMQFEAFLRKHKRGKKIDATVKKDLKDFEDWADRRNLKTNQYLWGIKEYFDYLCKTNLRFEIDAMLGRRYLSRFKLKDFSGVTPLHIGQLKKAGITTAEDMLYAGVTNRKRVEISRHTGIPLEEVETLVKLSDQARIGGHKKVRARLYHDAGFDTIDKMAACDAATLRTALVNFIETTGFSGIPPTPGEAQHTVEMARYLKRLVEY